MDDYSDVELLALLLAPGNTERRAFAQAVGLQRRLGSLAELRDVSYGRLTSWGLSPRQAMGVRAAEALFRRVRQVPLEVGQSFRSSSDIFRHFQPRFEASKKECFWAVLLDGKNRYLRAVRISEGSLTSSLAHPREVFRPAVREAAAGIIFVHNHPSGDPEPSSEDVQITRRLVETGKILGIRVLDHVIIGARKYYSFADQGTL